MRRALLAAVLVLLAAAPAAAAGDHARWASGPLTAARFADPPGGVRPTLLWFWNGEITPSLIDSQLAAMRAKGVGEVIIFPFDTPRLQPAFFTEGWFDDVGHALDVARATGMRVWLFNDSYFPSGKAGGRVAAEHPELRAQRISRTTAGIKGGAAVDVRAAFPPGPLPAGLSWLPEGRLLADRSNFALLNRGARWTDYDLAFTARPRQTGGGGTFAQAGWTFRASEPGTGYLWIIGNYPHPGAEGGNLTKVVARGGAYQVLDVVDLPFDVEAGRDYRVETSLRGDRIETRIDGRLVDVTTDGAFAAGRVGVRQDAANGESAAFDDLRVTAPDGTVLYEQSFDTAASLDDFRARTDPDDVVAVAALPVREGAATLDGVVDLTREFEDGTAWHAPAGDWRLEYFVRSYRDAGDGYLDLMSDEAVDRWTDAIHGEYARRFPEHMGTTLRGFWDDEPVLASWFGDTPWSPSLADALAGLGRRPGEVLPALFSDFGRAGRVERGRFWRAVSNRMADALYGRQQAWAERAGVQLISNPQNDDLGPTAGLGSLGDAFKDHQHFAVPGHDAIFDQVVPGRRQVLGRTASSSAHQNDRVRAMSENFGAYGWDLTPEVARYANGNLALRGINLTVLHAFWSDPSDVVYPPAFDPSNPWWEPAMAPLQTWTGRVMEANLGRAAAETVLIQPQRAAETWQRGGADARIDHPFHEAVYALERAQVDFDLLTEAALDGDPEIAEPARAAGRHLRVGPQRYETVVVPETPTLSLETVRTLLAHERGPGRVLLVGALPDEETLGRDAALAAALDRLLAAGARRVPGTEALGAAAAGAGAQGVRLSEPDPDVRVLRRLRARDTVFLVSNEGEHVVRGGGTFPATGRPQILDPDDGSVRDAPVWRRDGAGTWVDFALEPYEVAVIAFRDRREPRTHLTASPLAVEAFDGREAAVVAERPGRWTLEGVDGPRRLTGSVSVGDPLEPIALDGGPEFEVDLTATDLAPGRRLILDLGSVRDACVRDVYVVDIDTPLDEVLLALTESHRGSALVVKNTKLAGILTTSDVCRFLADLLQQRFPPPPDGDTAA